MSVTESKASIVPDTAFILAAGMGTRLRPYTDAVPKPMVNVNGRSLISRAIEKLERAGVTRIVVNLHYKADILKAHLSDIQGPEILFSYEPSLLDTGGGVKQALPMLGTKPFYVIAGDALWTDGPEGDSLQHLANYWNDATMDILTYMQPLDTMRLTSGLGDYNLTQNGRAVRLPCKTGSHMWTNVRINHPRIFESAPGGAFSFLTLLDQAQQKDRLYAMEHRGEWHHISTAADLERVDAAYSREKKYA